MKESLKFNNEAKISHEGLNDLRTETHNRAAEVIKNRVEKESSLAEKSEAEAREQLEKVIEKSEAEEVKQEKKKQPAKAERLITKEDRKDSFKKTMETVQSQLPKSSRTFSKVIHNPTIEKVSEVTGRTVARPNAILSGSVAAFVLTLAIYTLAKINGYPLSGFETIAAFTIGWLAGMLFDYIRIGVKGGSSS
jgi:hypothetical protein